MKDPIKGSRCERKVSMDGTVPEESFGPPAAIPFKWEEAPGKAKPKEEESRDTEIKRDGDFYNLLVHKGDSLGHSSGSLYRSADLGSIPFEWEAEPGKPKTPARVEMLVPLNPPPGLQSPAMSASPARNITGWRWSSQSLIKWIFHNHHHHHQNKVYSGPMISPISSSQEFQELGGTKSSRISDLPGLNRLQSSDGRSEFGSATSFSSCSWHTDSSRIGSPRQESGRLLHTRNFKSRNSHHSDPTGQSCLRHESSSNNYILQDQKVADHAEEIKDDQMKECNTIQSVYTIHKDDNDEALIDKGNDEDSEFQDTFSEFLGSEEVKEEMKCVVISNAAADKEKESIVVERSEMNMELEILMRFGQVDVGNKKVVKMHACKIAARRRGCLSCLPLCSFTSREARVYEDCMDCKGCISSHSNAISHSNDLDRGF